jgi:hypothetical protein
MSDSIPNSKPADRLHDIRQPISALRDQEQELRRGFITGALDPAGDEYVVTVETKLNQRIDLDAMREHVPERIWRPYVVSKETAYVSVRRKQARFDALVKELEVAGYRIISGTNDALIDWRTGEALGYDGPDNERPGNWCHIDHVLRQ